MSNEVVNLPVGGGGKSFQCAIGGCDHRAVWKPILMVKPIGWRFRKNTAEAPLVFDNFLCDDHGRNMPVDKLVTPEAWKDIEQMFQRQGLAEPDRKTARVVIAKVQAAK